MAEIIVVDDDPDVAELVADVLAGAGHAVRHAADGAALRRLVAERRADLAVLDIGLPGEDGLRLARWLREHHDPGIVMLTGAGTLVDRVVGLEVGADDYVAKPFALAELRARVEAVLRRRQPRRPAPGVGDADAAVVRPPPEGMVRFGPYLFDKRRFLLLRGEPGGGGPGGDGAEVVPLSAMELDLVAAFALHPGRALSREDLMRLAPPRGEDSLERSVDNRVTRLRRKLEADPERPELVKTLRGAGYVFPG